MSTILYENLLKKDRDYMKKQYLAEIKKLNDKIAKINEKIERIDEVDIFYDCDNVDHALSQS